MNRGRVSYAEQASDPDLQIWWLSEDDTLVNFSSGYTFRLTIGDQLLVKTTGITGAAGSGTGPDNGTPNLTVHWSPGDLNLTAGTYSLQITPILSGRERDSLDATIELRPRR